MPRTNKAESPGCPPFRILTSDVLGLIKVTECRGKAGIPKSVENWGSPDASRAILAASFAEDHVHPLFAVGRKNGGVELINPLSGKIVTSFLLREVCSDGGIAEDDLVTGLHAFMNGKAEVSSKMGSLLICTENRKAFFFSFKFEDFSLVDSPFIWDVSPKGKILCSSLAGDHCHALFAGKGVELNVWDLDGCRKIWMSKPPAANNLGIFTPTCFTATSFLTKHDSRKIVAGTNNHQIRLYDSSAQRKPMISIDFREASIRSLATDSEGNVIYAGTGAGDLASFDIRTGKLLGCFIGKCNGSIRSIARHPELPLIASCGLDGYLRLWDAETRQPLSAVFLKQQLTCLAFDPCFSDEEPISEVDNLEGTVADQSKAGKKRSDPSSQSAENKKKKNKMKKTKIPSSEDDDNDD